MAKLYAVKSRDDYWFRNVQALAKELLVGMWMGYSMLWDLYCI